MFVKVKGTPNKPNSIIVDLIGFHIMDVGTQGYTEFDYDESIIDVYEKYPEYMNCRMGMLHSHNTMATFFSHTDMEELEDNTTDTDYMVSLIVNNSSKYSAKIAWRTDEEIVVETTGWFDEKTIKTKNVHKNPSLYTINLDIEIEGIDDLAIIDARIIEVEKLKEDKAKLALKDKKLNQKATLTFAGESLHMHNQQNSQTSIFSEDTFRENELEEVHEFGNLGIPAMNGETFNNLLGCIIVQKLQYSGNLLTAMGEVKRKVKIDSLPILVEMIIDNIEDFYEQHYGELCTMEASMELCAAFSKELREYNSINFPIVEPLIAALSIELGEEELNKTFP